jgi:hypothetical protein
MPDSIYIVAMNRENLNKMLPLILGIGIVALLIDAFTDEDKKSSKRSNKKGRHVKKTKRLFISFAFEDSKYRDFLVAQAKNENSPFTFIDMSVKEPWDEKEWKIKCRTKIRSCDGMIVLLSKNTWHSSGSRWEIKCACEEQVPVIGMHIRQDDKGAVPPELNGQKIIIWSWDNLEMVINKI